MPSKDLLEKLFDVEHEAESLVAAAREEAGRRLDAAKTRAQQHYSEAYDGARAKALDAREASERSARDEYEREVRGFREKLEASRIDKAAFAAACEAALGEGR